MVECLNRLVPAVFVLQLLLTSKSFLYIQLLFQLRGLEYTVFTLSLSIADVKITIAEY